MNLKKIVTTMSSALLLLVLSGSAFAQVIFFGEDLGAGEGTPLASTPNSDVARNDFIANLSGVGTEDFEGFSENDPAPLLVDFGAAGTATLTGSGSIVDVPAGTTNGFGRYAISGTKFWETDSDFTITFTDPQAAVGFYGIDVGDFSGQMKLTYINGDETTVDIPHTVNSPGGTVIYFGLIAEVDFNSITFTNSNAGDVFGFDDFTSGTRAQVSRPAPVPVPATNNLGLVLMILLTAGIGVSMLGRRAVS